MDLSFKNIFSKLWILEISVPPQKHHCTFGLSSSAHLHKGPRPQNSTKTKRAHTETAPATLRKRHPGDGAPRFRKAPLLVFLRLLFTSLAPGLPQAEQPWLAGVCCC